MKYEIKKLEEHEVKEAVELFKATVDELHANRSNVERLHYKATHPVKKVKVMGVYLQGFLEEVYGLLPLFFPVFTQTIFINIQ